MSYLKNRKNAFVHAFNGLGQAFKTEIHLKLFLVIAIVVIAFAFYLKVSETDWIRLLICISLVLCLELVNSAIEKLCDLVMPEKHPKIKYIKDVMAGAVLLACFFAAIIGVIVFKNYL